MYKDFKYRKRIRIEFDPKDWYMVEHAICAPSKIYRFTPAKDESCYFNFKSEVSFDKIAPTPQELEDDRTEITKSEAFLCYVAGQMATSPAQLKEFLGNDYLSKINEFSSTIKSPILREAFEEAECKINNEIERLNNKRKEITEKGGDGLVAVWHDDAVHKWLNFYEPRMADNIGKYGTFDQTDWRCRNWEAVYLGTPERSDHHMVIEMLSFTENPKIIEALRKKITAYTIGGKVIDITEDSKKEKSPEEREASSDDGKKQGKQDSEME